MLHGDIFVILKILKMEMKQSGFLYLVDAA